MKTITLILFFIISIFQLPKKGTTAKMISSGCSDSVFWKMDFYDEGGNLYSFKKKMPAPITKKDSIDLLNYALEEIKIIRIRAKF